MERVVRERERQTDRERERQTDRQREDKMRNGESWYSDRKE